MTNEELAKLKAIVTKTSQATSGTSALSPEFLEWARRQFTEEEIIAGLRELRERGGLELSQFIHELEQIADQ